MAISAVDGDLHIVRRAAASIGYLRLNLDQEQAIIADVRGRGVFISLPMGFGKSLCFGLLPQVFDTLKGTERQSIVMEMSPLVAVMKERVASFSSRGISAAYVSDKDD